MPVTTTTSDIQRSYRRVFDQAKKFGSVIVLTNNKPDVAIVSIKELQKLRQQQQQIELKKALSAISSYKKDKKENKLIQAGSLSDLS